MKKTALLITAFAASCAAFIALNCKANADTVTVNGVKDGESFITCEYDADGDRITDSLLKITIEPSGSVATINQFFTRAVNVTVPDTITVNYPSGSKEYQPMILNYIYPENGQALQSVEVPACVKIIIGKAFGYSSNGTKYNRSSSEQPAPVYGAKLTNFKVICPENSAAENYARANGLISEVLINELDPLNIKAKLKSDSFTYSGSEIRPEYTLTDSEGTNITQSGIYSGSKYTVLYRNNINSGTGSLVAKSNTSSDELTIATFTINKVGIANNPDFKISKIGKATYNGSLSAPSVEMTYKSVPLRMSSDYIVIADNSSIANGKAKGTIIFLGNFSGSLPIEFDVETAASPISGFNAVSTGSGVLTSWNPIKDCNLIFIYRVSGKNSAQTLVNISSGTSTSYLDTAAPDTEDCTYYIQATAAFEGKTQNFTSEKVTVPAKYSTPATTLTIGNGKITISWNKTLADGYIVKMDGEQIHDTLSGDITSYTKTGLKNYEKHVFTVTPYTKSNGKVTYKLESEQLSTLGVDSIINSAKTTDTRSFKVINKQATNTTVSTITITDNDIAVLEKFAKEHFTSDMTDAQKLETTLNWLNRSLKYASSAADWSNIGNKSYADAAFTYKLGQCAQYNGAMVYMMRYLGYDANLICGWRGTWKSNYWQHYWGEVEIDGMRYIIEAGNYGKSGNWSFLLVPYERADGKYITNCKNVALDRSFNDYNPWNGWSWWY